MRIMLNTFKEFLLEETLKESSLSRLWRKYQQCDSGTISAFRGNLTYKENMERSRKLSAILLGLNYSVTSIDGVYIENYGSNQEQQVKEKSFIVFDAKQKGNLKKDLLKLGEMFDQDSITYNDVQRGEYVLIGTSKRDNYYPGYKNEVILGKPMFGEDGEFCSLVKGRPFVFKEGIDYCDDTLLNYSTWHKAVLVREARKI